MDFSIIGEELSRITSLYKKLKFVKEIKEHGLLYKKILRKNYIIIS